MERIGVIVDGAPAIGPYSHACISGDLVYLSGQAALDSTTLKLVEGGVKEETIQCFKNLKTVLNEMDLDFEDVIKVNVYLTSMADFSEMNEVYATIFNKPYPARTTVGVLELPASASVEIEMIARLK